MMAPRYAGILLVVAGSLLVSSCAGRLSVGVSGPPICPYGYYEAPPYYCAPDGYYGPEWFPSGVFIGAGPWFHGPRGFYGHVDHAFDFRRGYRGPRPTRGTPPAPRRSPFRGQDMHNPRGREAPRGRR